MSEELTFWTCYQKNGDKFNYLGDGEGHVRLFKTETALNEFLDNSKVDKDAVVIHSIAGKFAVPEPEITADAMKLFTNRTPIPPSAMELLKSYRQKRGSRK